MSNLTKVLSDVQAKRQELTEQVKAVLASGIQDFMKEHPTIKCITWTQFTPYFMDGDECVFRVNGFHVSATSTDAGEMHDEENFTEVHSYKSFKIPEVFSPQLWSELVEFTELLSGATDDLKAAFGDHAKVIVTQTGVDVESYEHE